ncbi:AraC family transcriptional regulator [Planctomicrobium sp. SH664]|uniref:helix-turn-helix transcriptional regulator n=1 Tax=Planctomicrobium sp. SH664 TaxID=3448125 RepID=UPI003F5AFE16
MSPKAGCSFPEQSVGAGVIQMPLVQRVAVIQSQQASRIVWHAHELFEVLFLFDGATSYEFADGQTVELLGGHFLVVPPRVRHRGLFETRHPVRLCGVMMNFQSPNARQNTPFQRQDLEWLHARCLEGGQKVFRMSVELARSVRTLAKAVTANCFSEPMAHVSLRVQLCAALMEAGRQIQAKRSSLPSRAAQQAVEFLEKHSAEKFSMDAVAAAAGCSRARLFHVFKEAMGMSPNDYLQRLRLKQAQLALAGSDLPITQIAMDCGFSTSQYFSHVFRKYLGSSPSDYRLQHVHGSESLAATRH